MCLNTTFLGKFFFHDPALFSFFLWENVPLMILTKHCKTINVVIRQLSTAGAYSGGGGLGGSKHDWLGMKKRLYLMSIDVI